MYRLISNKNLMEKIIISKETGFYYEIYLKTIRQLKGYCDNVQFVLLPHQRAFKSDINHTKTFIESILNGKLTDFPIKLSDLKSCKEKSMGTEDEEFFNTYLDEGRVYGIEDGQHRINAIMEINESHFEGEFKDKFEEYMNTKVPVFVYYGATRNELIDKFLVTNNSRTVNTKEKMWAKDNEFNRTIKKIFVDDDKYLKLYSITEKTDKSKREFYGGVVKMIKVCGAYDKVFDSVKTSTSSLLSFIESNIGIEKFSNSTSLFGEWYEIISTYNTKFSSKFAHQSNLFFLLHILKNKNLKWDKEKIKNYLLGLTDTRMGPEVRYANILKNFEHEGM